VSIFIELTAKVTLFLFTYGKVAKEFARGAKVYKWINARIASHGEAGSRSELVLLF
jgi:hypothetical protein